MAPSLKQHVTKLKSWFGSDTGLPYSKYLDEDTEPCIDQSLNKEVDVEKLGESLSRSRSSFWRIFTKVAATASLFLLGTFIFSKLLSDSGSGQMSLVAIERKEAKYAHCGNNPEEAKAQGCVWDLMSFSWEHPSCFDQEESDRWIKRFGPWEWYDELPGTNSTELRPLTSEELPYTPIAFTTQGYHVQHCLYIMKMIHQAGMKRIPLVDEGVGLGHTEHCIELMTNENLVPMKLVNTRLELLFLRCVELPGYDIRRKKEEELKALSPN